MYKLNEACQKCGSFAGFEKSPEGNNCGLCGEWVCDNCVDYKVSMREYLLPDGQAIAESIICKDCSNKFKLRNLTPIKNL